MTLIDQFQTRVFNWQRDVAGQPVTTQREKADKVFCRQQLGFVMSEWFGEYMPHAVAYHKKAGEVSKMLLNEKRESGLWVLNEEIETLRVSIADDIGDVAFTVLGLLNAHGVKAASTCMDQLTWSSQVRREAEISSSLRLAANRGARNIYWDVLCTNIIVDLIGIANHYGFRMTDALRAVCNSNDTKLWTAEEIAVGGERIEREGLTYELVNKDALRSYRVKNKDTKLIKSPSFNPPDFTSVVQAFVRLT